MKKSPIEVLIVEDDILLSEQLEQFLIEMGYKAFAKAASYQDAISELSQKLPDLILIDIHLKGNKTGIDLAAHIHEHFQIPFIFVTSYKDRQTIEAAKQYQPYAYLIKPFDQDDLFAAIETTLARFGHGLQDKQDDSNSTLYRDVIYIKQNQHFNRIPLTEIGYIKANDNYVEVFTASKSWMVRSTIKKIEESLPKNFVRIHRSYLINMDLVQKISIDEVVIFNKEIPASRSFMAPLLDRLPIFGQKTE